MGLYSLIFALATALGPWLGMLAYTHHGPGAAWGGCLLLGCASAAALYAFRVPEGAR
jgi:predicted MFS family arabinose efflux permease